MSVIETLRNNFAKKPLDNEIYISNNPNAKFNIINNTGEKLFFKDPRNDSFLGEIETGEESSIYLRIAESYERNYIFLDLYIDTISTESFLSIFITIGERETGEKILYLDLSNQDFLIVGDGVSLDNEFGCIITSREDFTIELGQPQE